LYQQIIPAMNRTSVSVAQDKGCILHPKCVLCPEPVCIEDLPRDQQKRRESMQIKKAEDLRDQGKTLKEIARIMNKSQRTIQIYLRWR